MDRVDRVPKESWIDMNGDGISDEIRGTMRSRQDTDATGRGTISEGFDVGVFLHTRRNRLISLGSAPEGIGGFWKTLKIFACTSTGVRFFPSKGLASFVA